MTNEVAATETAEAATAAASGGAAEQTTGATTQTGQAAADGADAGTGVKPILGGDQTGVEAPMQDAAGDSATAAAAEGKTTAVDPADVVPEDGKYALTLPEGVEVDEAALAVVAPTFKEIGLTNGQASKLALAFADLRKREAAEADEAWKARLAGWVAEAKADKTYAVVGFEAAAKVANRGLSAVLSPASISLLAASGLGNHPDIIRDFYRFGARLADDRTERGTNTAAAPVPMEETMYGATTPTKRRA